MPQKKGQVSRQTLWQRKHRQQGLCVVCSEPAYKGWRCVRHYEQHKITMRLRYIPKVRGRYDVGGSAQFLAAADRDQDRKKNKRTRAGKKKAAKLTQAEATPQPNAPEFGSARGADAGRGRGGGFGSGSTD
ncbi:MAG: hypothetical protein P8R42_21830 [Candidatus Binatia bacterium]|nr:hypothetical protein [Candidatus Binatia bacterium]